MYAMVSSNVDDRVDYDFFYILIERDEEKCRENAKADDYTAHLFSFWKNQFAEFFY